MESSTPSKSSSMPLPKLPTDELLDRINRNLDKMDRQEVEKQRRREALEELRWRETCTKRSNGDRESPLSPTWVSTGGLSDESLFEKIQLKPSEVDAVSSSIPAKDSPAKNGSFPEPLSQSKYYSTATKEEPKPIPKEELMRRHEVEQELIALSKKITEETLRKEKMVPLIKPTFDPFASSDTAAADSSYSSSSFKSDSEGGKSDLKSNSNPRKRRNGSNDSKKSHRNIEAIRVPSQASAYCARDESFYGPGGYMGLGCYRQYSPEEEEVLDDFVTLLDKYVPAYPKRRKKKPSTSTESSQVEDRE